MSGVRSKNGCQTCRIRKKKCDELRPVCLNCSSRNIPCYGYERDATLLGEFQEDAEILKSIKHAAESRYKARRRKWWTDSGDPSSSQNLDDACVQGLSGQSGCTDGNLNSDQMVIWQEPLPLEKQGFSMCPPIGSTALTLPQHSAIANKYDVSLPYAKHVNVLPTMDSIWWHSGIANNGNIQNNRELGVLMNYFDNVFSLQFGFNETPTSGIGCGWFLNALFRSKPLYNATLSLSVYYQALQRQRNINRQTAFSPDADQTYGLTLKGLQQQLTLLKDLSGTELLIARFEILGSMNQLLSIEVFREFGGNWDVHLNAAKNFLMIIGSRPATSKLSKNSSHQPVRLKNLEKILREPNCQFLASSDIIAFKFFVSCFIWADVLSCASGLRTFETDSFDYINLLDDDTLELHKIMGCHNWVMITILKIANLDDCKKTISPNNTLALQEFLDEAMRLQCSLETGIATLLHSRLTLIHLQQDSNLVTEIYAHAALTYLHVVISGANSDIPEVRISVARALSALILLPSRLLIRVSWPFCIVACMAGPEQEASFREVFREAVANGEPIGTLWKGLRVAEECWKLRGLWGGNKLAWKTAMVSLGVKVLLI